MIDASSSIASGILSGTLGTPAASSGSPLTTIPGVSTDSTSTAAYILDGSLSSLGALTSPASFLSNAVFAQDTQNLLLNPLANGAITGKPSANVQKILSELDPTLNAASSTPATSTSTPTSSSDNSIATDDTDTDSTDSTDSTSGLPADGVLA